MGGTRSLVLGRVAGLLFLAGALAAVPSNLLLTDPRPEWWVVLVNLMGAITGGIILLTPWDRISRRWLHLIPPLSVAEIVFSVTALGEHGDVFLWYFILSAVYVGYAFRGRAEVAFHMGVAGLGIISTAIYASSFDVDAIPRALTGIPVVWIACGVVVWLREGLELRERTDPLTGLGNRRALMEALEDVFALDQTRLLVLFDLDGFKRYNDRLGHAAGDELLERFGAQLNAVVGKRDGAFRLGGDELCVLLDDESPIAACVEALTGEGVTASYGTAWLPREADSQSTALSLADTRMYAAKRANRAAPFTVTTTESPSPLRPNHPNRPLGPAQAR